MSIGHGYAEPKRLLLGGGDLYLNDIFVGNLKGPVTFTYSPKYAFQRPGNSIADVKGTRIEESVMLTASICDFKVSQLRRALGINASVVSGSTGSVLRKQEVLKLSGTSNVTTLDSMVAGTLKVTKLDRSTAYASGTDYSATATTLARKSGGTIASAGQYLIVEYDFTDSGANYLRVGGEKTTPNTFAVQFVHQLSNGKLVQVTLFKAMAINDLSIAFEEASSGNYTVHGIGFKALVDLTKPQGSNLFEIIEEDTLS